ncbi:hypothetical protein EVG20_g5850 [Dentipellis fragilis]|uniref:GmrSD restriction endonucleases N-terminal domain-containing protein n=1 Tax=Dentipellis fragilis TaxID=205917 RepID=A0A4Y9YSP7_9AGAM|nr:hypothetical protein EVG20_g5850 [Dentipellis fragilis]
MSFSDFDYSDFTDISSSDEDDYVPLSQARKGAKKKKPTAKPYTVTGQLRPPRAAQYSVKSLYDQIVEGNIDLDPEYQRDVVWPDSKQIGLIDSVFRHYYIPPVIFAVSTSDDGVERRVCIDGKQRLTSLQKFVDGFIPHKDNATGKKYWYKHAGPGRRALLPKHLLQTFANKQIVCVEYDDLTDDQEREIFQRVQLGVALTPAERMAAITGPWPSFIRDIQNQVLGDEGFGDVSEFGKTRGRDFQAVVSVVFVIEKLPTFTTPGAAQLEKWLQRTTAVPKKLREEVLTTFKILLHLMRDKKYRTSFEKPTRVSPVEFVMIGLLIHQHRDSLSFTQLASAIEKMRTDVRTKEKDIRTNGRVTKAMFNFIMKQIGKITLKSDGKGDKSAATQLSNPMAAPKKRKRAIESSDDEDSDLRPAVKTSTKASKTTITIPPRGKVTKATKTASNAQAVNGAKSISKPKVAPTAGTSTRPAKQPPPVASTSKAPIESKTAASSKGPVKGNAATSRPQKAPVKTNLPRASTDASIPTPSPLSEVAPSPVLPQPPDQTSSTMASPATPVVTQKQPAPPAQTPRVAQSPPVFIKPEPEPDRPLGAGRLAAIRAARAAAVNSPQGTPGAGASAQTSLPAAQNDHFFVKQERMSPPPLSAFLPRSNTEPNLGSASQPIVIDDDDDDVTPQQTQPLTRRQTFAYGTQQPMSYPNFATPNSNMPPQVNQNGGQPAAGGVSGVDSQAIEALLSAAGIPIPGRNASLPPFMNNGQMPLVQSQSMPNGFFQQSNPMTSNTGISANPGLMFGNVPPQNMTPEQRAALQHAIGVFGNSPSIRNMPLPPPTGPAAMQWPAPNGQVPIPIPGAPIPIPGAASASAPPLRRHDTEMAPPLSVSPRSSFSDRRNSDRFDYERDPRDREYGRDGGRDYSRSRDYRDREYDRDRDRDRDHGRDKDRERGRDREYERDRERGREKDYDYDYDHGRGRGRGSRSRGRDYHDSGHRYESSRGRERERDRYEDRGRRRDWEKRGSEERDSKDWFRDHMRDMEKGKEKERERDGR